MAIRVLAELMWCYLEQRILRRLPHLSTQKAELNRPGTKIQVFANSDFSLSHIMCRLAVTPPGLAREDWKIIRALAEVGLIESVVCCSALWDHFDKGYLSNIEVLCFIWKTRDGGCE